MSVIITGGAGFLGSHLAERLVDEGKEVLAIDNLENSEKSNLDEIIDEPNFEFVNADLRENDNLDDLIEEGDKVYHLAAKIGGVGYLRDKPADIIADNDLINRNVFEVCSEQNVERVVYASSSMLYSETEEFPSSEEDVEELPPPRGSYGFQKLNGEYYCDAYSRQYDLDYAAVRIFNGVGPRDWPEEEVGHGHVIPDMVKKIIELEQDPVKVKGSGQQTRCFTDVRDLVRGMEKAMNTEKARNEAINLGSTDEISINDLVRKIWNLSDRKGDPNLETEKSFEKDVKRRVTDNSKAKELLDWKCSFELDETLEYYIESYREEILNGA